MIVACWSGPRNISTALMRSWSSRNDTYVIDEPLYAHYLYKKKLKHPMYEEIIEHYSTDYKDIIQRITNDAHINNKISYQKHMAHHLLDLNNIEWIGKFENCILIRHPEEVISSYSSKNHINSVNDLGYPQQYKIAKYLRKNNQSFIVIDSKDLLHNPRKVLSNWCKKININFELSMLSWRKGNHPNDGIWWKHWYDNVITTTGFEKYCQKDITIENQYDSIYNESMRYYKYLQEFV